MFDHEKIAFHWVNRLGFLVRKDLSNRFQQAGTAVSAEDWAILLVLWKNGPQSPGALADVTVKDRTTVTRLIDGMVRKGLVSRTEDNRDRRKSIVAPTARGVALQAELVPIAQAMIAEASDGISPEDIETTTRTLRAMTENLLADRSASSPSKGHQI